MTTQSTSLILPPTPDLSIFANGKQLRPEVEMMLTNAYAPFFADAHQILTEAESLTVTDPADAEGQREARKQRLKLQRVRIDCQDKHDDLKKDVLVLGRAIDGVNNVLRDGVKKREAELMEMETLAERMEEQRLNALRDDRLNQLPGLKYIPQVDDLAKLTDEEWAKELAECNRRFADDAAAAKREQEAKDAEDRKRAEEAAKLKADNAKLAEEARILREEREAAESKRKAEQSKADAQLKAANEAKLKAERDAQALRDAEADARRQKEEAERKAACAPDREKIMAFADMIDALTVPEMATEPGKVVAGSVARQVAGLAKWIRAQVVGL